MLTGELPGARLEPPSHKVQIDVRLDEVVLRALAVEPELRYATAAEFRTQVGTVGKGMTPPPGVAADPSKVPRLLKTSGGFLYRPEDFGTFEGQMCPWLHRGQFVLDDERFNYLKDGRNLVIPLASIREVSIGAYPRSMNPAGLDLLKVRFGDPGAEQTVLLMPAEGWFALPSTWNGRVAEWAPASPELRGPGDRTRTGPVATGRASAHMEELLAHLSAAPGDGHSRHRGGPHAFAAQQPARD